MGALTVLISEVQSQSTTHTQRVSAQLDCLRSTMEAHTTTTKADLVDIRGRLVPYLRDRSNTLASDVQRLEAQFGEQTTALASTIQRLEDRLGNFNPTDFTLTVDWFEERLDALRVALEANTSHPCGACVPPVDVIAGAHVSPTEADDAMPRPPDIGGGRFAYIDPTFRPTFSWFARDTPRLDASAICDSGTHTHPNAPSSTDDDTVPLMGGRITSPRATDKERQARKLHISRHDIAGLASPLYHGGRLGVPDLSLSFIHACGYHSFSAEIEDDVLPCYGTIQLLHKQVKMAWTNPCTL